jgi:hypothetical protein
MTPEDQALGYMANFITMAFVDLRDCLRESGALRPGQFERALHATIDHPNAQRERLDYKLLASLVGTLEGSHPKLN